MEIELKPASENDLMCLFELSNDDLVRKNSFQSNKINLEDHKKWFIGKLNNKNSLILKATAADEFVGQVRFDFGKENVMGVSIAKDFRGRGLGSILIKKGLDYIKTNKKNISNIIACIKEDNISSIRSFEKAGFILDDRIEISGIKAFKYIYFINENRKI